MSGASAFREAFMASDSKADDHFGDYNARQLRYEIYWAFFENSAYRHIHRWAVKYKTDYGLYKYIRNIYNPAYRLGDFWQSHLMGGQLDPEAGDGSQSPSALPITTDNAALRPAIARLWRDSNWQANKDLLTLHGAVLGDCLIQPVDDVARQKVYLRVVHPGTISAIEVDPFGNVKGYQITENRPDPRNPRGQPVTYIETAERGEDDEIAFRTLLNGAPYAWNGQAAEWSEPYGFVPLVKIQHISMGLDWGWSELHPGLARIREVDDLASKLSDQMRKNVDAPMLLTGVTKPDTTPRPQNSQAQVSSPETGREEIPTLYGPAGSDVKFLIAPMDVNAALAHVGGILKELERDYPELQMDIWSASGDTSGRALRVARQRTESKAQKRRPNYDDGLVRAQQMAIAVGGYRGYDPYRGFGLESYAAGDLDHSIGKRPVFASDPLDDLEYEKIFWEAANAAKLAGGMPALLKFLRGHGWSNEETAAIQSAPDNAPFTGYP
jgi:hypothetical protein